MRAGLIVIALLAASSCYELSPSGFLDGGTDADTDTDTGPAFDGELEWVVQAGANVPTNDIGISVDAFSDGDLLITGFYVNGAVFGLGEANETTLEASPCHDMFIARYDRDGALEWVKRVGAEPEATGTNHNSGYYIKTLSDGSFVIGGLFIGTTPVIFGDGEPNETALQPTSADYWDVYVARFNADGTLAWARMAGGDWDDLFAQAAISESAGAVWIVGTFSGDAKFGAGEAKEVVLTTSSFCDDVDIPGKTMFVASYELATGDLQWAKQAQGCSSGASISSAPDSDYLLVTGRYDETATFGEGAGAVQLTTAGEDDVYVARFAAADGALDWAVSAGGSGIDRGTSIAALGGGSAFVIGYFGTTAVFGAGSPNETILDAIAGSGLFTAFYTEAGDLVWAKANGTGGEGAWSTYGWPLLFALEGGDYVIGGQFIDTVAFGAGGPAEIGFESRGANDLFLARFDPEGALIWARQEGGEDEDWFGGMAVPIEGKMVVTGMFGGQVAFGMGEENETTLTEFGADGTSKGDIFLMKLAIEE